MGNSSRRDDDSLLIFILTCLILLGISAAGFNWLTNNILSANIPWYADFLVGFFVDARPIVSLCAIFFILNYWGAITLPLLGVN